MKPIAYACVAILIAGCSITGSQLRANPDGSIEYTTQENYKVVFRRIVQASKRCYETGGRRIEANIFDDNESAEITLAIIYGGSIRALYVIDLNSINSQSTQTVGYFLNRAWKKGVEDSKEWAVGNLDVCSITTAMSPKNSDFL